MRTLRRRRRNRRNGKLSFFNSIFGKGSMRITLTLFPMYIFGPCDVLNTLIDSICVFEDGVIVFSNSDGGYLSSFLIYTRAR